VNGGRRDHNGDTGVDILSKSMGDQCLGGLPENSPDAMVTWLIQSVSKRVKGMHSGLVRGPEPATQGDCQ